MTRPAQRAGAGPAGRDPQLSRAFAMLNEGNFRGAERLLLSLSKARPRDASVLQGLAIAQSRSGRLQVALRTLAKVRKLAPNRPEPLLEQAQVLRACGRFDEGLRAARVAHEMAPNDPATIATKAELLQMTGDLDGAWALLREAEAKGLVRGNAVLAYAEVARLRGAPEEAIDVLRAHVEQPGLPRVDKRAGLFRLGALLDAAKRHDEAFRTIDEAQRVIPVRHDPEGFSRAVDRLIEVSTREALEGTPRARDASELPVLVVGMPRSGTTLVEQIIASHPEGAGASELGDITKLVMELEVDKSPLALMTRLDAIKQGPLDRASRAYLRRLREQGPKAERVVDKMPMNALHLGLASRLLPGARVVHCRRDPMDTCVSCYFQNFAGNMPWAHDLRSLGAFHRDCDRLMEHWREVIDVPMLEVRYEELIGDQEAVTRAIIEFLGLEWDDACLRFHESKRVAATASNAQVRKPMYRTSVERWRRYERHLGPLKRALGLDDQRGAGSSVQSGEEAS